jgi:hypothetical protein
MHPEQELLSIMSLNSADYSSQPVPDLMYYYNYVVWKLKDGVLLFHSYYLTLKKSKDIYTLVRLKPSAGKSCDNSNNRDKAIAYSKIAINFGKTAQYEKLLVLGNLYLGQQQSNKGFFVASSVSLKNAFEIFVKRNDTANMLRAKNSSAILYIQNYFYGAAKKEQASSTFNAS